MCPRQCYGMIRIKKIYDNPQASDGQRILVDRLWPRGMTKEKARVDSWLKDIAPSNELRKWFGRNPDRWAGFKKNYLEELKDKKALISELKLLSKKENITLLYAAHDPIRNNAVVLKEILQDIDI